MSTAAIVGVTAAAGIGSAAIGASAAGNAADTQANAAMQAAELQHEDAQAAQQFQRDQWNYDKSVQAPWVAAGQGAISKLSSDLQNGQYPDWTGQFTAPTDVTEQNDPGYQFRLKMGQQALERSAAARGGLLTGGTAKALNAYAQDYASNEYGNVYDRAFNQYAQRYNEFQNNNTQRFNRYATMAGIGQTSANQLGYMGQSAANNMGNILLTSGQQIGNDYNNAAAARASGYIGQANAYGNMFSGLGNAASTYAMLNSMGGGGGGDVVNASAGFDPSMFNVPTSGVSTTNPLDSLGGNL